MGEYWEQDAGCEQDAGEARKEFEAIVCREPQLIASWRLQTETLPAMMDKDGSSIMRARLLGGLIASFKKDRGLDVHSELKKADISFLSGLDYVQEMTGSDVMVPVLKFRTAIDYFVFLRKLGFRGELRNSPSAVILLPWHYLTDRPDADIKGLRQLGIVAYCEDQLSDAIPPDEVLKLQILRSLDPLQGVRSGPDAVVLNELSAAVAAIVTADNRGNDIERAAGGFAFWTGAVAAAPFLSPSLIKLLPINPGVDNAGVDQYALAIADFVRELLARQRDTGLARKIWGCRNFEDLYLLMQKLWPEKYGALAPSTEINREAFAATVEMFFLLEEDEDHTAYGFAERAMTFHSQDPTLIWKAAAAFLDSNIGTGIRALQSIKDNSGHDELDLLHIDNFVITLEYGDGIYAVTIDW